MDTGERIARLVEPILRDHGAELYDVELAGAVVRVLVDRAGTSVTLADLEGLSREISAALDEDDPMPDRFELEVSSPGLERPLRRPEHFAAAVGTKVKIKTRPGAEGDRRVDGVIVGADDEAVTVETETGNRQVRYGDVERARTVFEWGGAPKPGTTKKRSASR